MRTKVTLVLLFLNVALFLFIVYLNKPGRVQPDINHPFSEAIPHVEALEVTGLGTAQPFRLAQGVDGWNLVQPYEWPANDFAVKRILSNLQVLRSETSFAVEDLERSGQSLSHYGLEKPSLVVTVTPARATPSSPAPAPVRLLIGDAVRVGKSVYVLSADGKRVHVVNRSLAESLAVPLDDLRSGEIFSIKHYEARSISIGSGEKTRIEEDTGRWSFGMPIVARANKAEVESTINSLNDLRVKSFAPAPDEAATGLAAPSLRVTIDGRKRHETLNLGEPVNKADTSPEREYYAQMEDRIPGRRSPVFTTVIATSLLEKLRSAQEKLRERRILLSSADFEFDPAAVTGITLTERGGESDVVLQRLDANQNSPVPAWQIVQRNPTGAPKVIPADRDVVQRLITSLAELQADKFANDGVTEAEKESYGLHRPARQITLSQASQTGAPARTVKLQFGTVETGVYAKLEHAPHVYQVGPEILQQTIADPLHYRERLLRALPAGAQITRLALTEIATDKRIVDTVVPPPAGAVSNRAAVDEVVNRLRTLRARRFRSNEFTKTVEVAGENRPWRYQLDATLALGGSAGSTPVTSTLLLSERLGGNTQVAGSTEYNVVFELEQELVDALFSLTYGSRDPGPTAPAPSPPAPAPAASTPASPVP